jgi:hypothetical protein
MLPLINKEKYFQILHSIEMPFINLSVVKDLVDKDYTEHIKFMVEKNPFSTTQAYLKMYFLGDRIVSRKIRIEEQLYVHKSRFLEKYMDLFAEYEKIYNKAIKDKRDMEKKQELFAALISDNFSGVWKSANQFRGVNYFIESFGIAYEFKFFGELSKSKIVDIIMNTNFKHVEFFENKINLASSELVVNDWLYISREWLRDV